MEENTNKIYSLIDQGKNSDIEGAIYRGLDFQMAQKALETSKDKIQMKKFIEKSYRKFMADNYGRKDDRR